MIIETPLPGRMHRGRDTYDLGDGRLLMVATDRISAFDVVLPGGIPGKGQVLNRISAFWFDKTAHIVPNHLICLADSSQAAGYLGGLGQTVPADVAQQAMVVKQAQRIDIECIVRGYITGSAWSEYRRQGTVQGQPMPEGLVEGQTFPEPLFTPTTKAEEGHDENMSAEQVVDMVGSEMAAKLEKTSKAVYSFAQAFALERGIILADTKMEFGTLDGELILIDELLTPDSSRFWDAEATIPGARSRTSTSSSFATGWTSRAGTTSRPRRSFPPMWPTGPPSVIVKPTCG